MTALNQPYQVMPPLAAEEYEALKADISARGVQVPVEYDESGNILDGYHRVLACRQLGLRKWPKLVRKGFSEIEKRQHARRLNLNRRHLNAAQRRELIADELQENPSLSDNSIGVALNVDGQTVGSVRREMQAAGRIQPSTVRLGRDGKTRRLPELSTDADNNNPFRFLLSDDTPIGRLLMMDLQTRCAILRREIALLELISSHVANPEFGACVRDCIAADTLARFLERTKQ